eukprot:COSAG01_NODE_380_length_17862_cov_20.427212_15_plen_257_part_00
MLVCVIMTWSRYHHNLATNSGMACVEIWYNDAGTSMSAVRFENNLCANIGNGGWSAAQREDPAGRSVCFYRNAANTSDVSIRNNVLYQTVGFEALLYLSDHWDEWAGPALSFSNNGLYKTSATPPPPPAHAGSPDEHEDYVKLIGASPMHVHSAADYAQFVKSHGGSGRHTILVTPGVRGLPPNAGGAVDMGALTKGGLEANSPLIGAGAKVAWTHDFHGAPIPSDAVAIGPFQPAKHVASHTLTASQAQEAPDTP